MANDEPNLRTAEPGTGSDAARLQAAASVNPQAELVLDLLAATGLVPEDRLAVGKGRAGQGGSLAQALAEEGVATSEGVARILAARSGLARVELGLTGVDAESAQEFEMYLKLAPNGPNAKEAQTNFDALKAYIKK